MKTAKWCLVTWINADGTLGKRLIQHAHLNTSLAVIRQCGGTNATWSFQPPPVFANVR